MNTNTRTRYQALAGILCENSDNNEADDQAQAMHEAQLRRLIRNELSMMLQKINERNDTSWMYHKKRERTHDQQRQHMFVGPGFVNSEL